LEGGGEGDVLVDECRRSLRAVHDATAAALDDTDMGLTLLLRTTTGRWPSAPTRCATGAPGSCTVWASRDRARRALSVEGREALARLHRADPARRRARGRQRGRGGALTEIVEFVRVAALLIREDVQAYRERH